MIYSIILLFLQSSSDVDRAVREVNREMSRSGGSGSSLIDLIFSPCCGIPLLILFVALLWFSTDLLKEAQRTGKIFNIKITRNRVVAFLAGVSLVVGAGLLLNHQRTRRLWLEEEKRKAELEVYFNEMNERVRVKAAQSGEVICGNKKYSEETCQRVKSMTVEEIIDVSRAFQVRLEQLAAERLKIVDEECTKKYIEPTKCNQMKIQESEKFFDVVKTITEVVPLDGR